MSGAVWGRPTDYNEELVDKICLRIAGGESLNRVCKDDGFPNITSVWKWLNKYPEFVSKYNKAREMQAEHLLDELVEIADDGKNDYMAKKDAEGAIQGWRENGEFINRSRLRIDTRKWAIGRLHPKKYGDKARLEMSGPDGKPIQTVGVVTDDPIEAARVYQAMLEAGEQ